MAGIMRVLLGALPFLLPTFFFLSFFYDLLLPRVGAHAFPPLPPRYADRPIAALDQGRIYFTSFSPQDTTRFYVRTTIEFIRESVEFQSSSVPDPISRSIIHIYIYIDSFFEIVYCFPPNILPSTLSLHSILE